MSVAGRIGRLERAAGVGACPMCTEPPPVPLARRNDPLPETACSFCGRERPLRIVVLTDPGRAEQVLDEMTAANERDRLEREGSGG